MAVADEKAPMRPDAPSLAPDDPAIDLGHLSRMTLGEEALEQEVLTLFGQQADVLLARMEHAPATVRATFAHTLKGSARGIGAWRVAEAADTVETSGGPDQIGDAALGRLIAAVAEVKAEIAQLLRMPPRPVGAGAARSKQ